jgi:hypothetical protein
MTVDNPRNIPTKPPIPESVPSKQSETLEGARLIPSPLGPKPASHQATRSLSPFPQPLRVLRDTSFYLLRSVVGATQFQTRA